ncbi:phospholipase D-like domain-containing protein [Haematobacter genomosp. 1]|uniref:Phospholipase D n=1 Tax=Haematobacter genomosp. 1 TaxID=366618 RepID=A0A212AF42_9RHOB|nr:phospholipase D-like domain-containing protein [Haematobacter genomosp. 1]OWJ80035.1 cardiolipin synthase A [Haematobacter genomosp. 1]
MQSYFPLILLFLAQAAVIARVLIRKDRQPAARLAWIMVVGTVPLLGMVLYFFFGEVTIRRETLARMEHAIRVLPKMPPPDPPPVLPERLVSSFQRVSAVNGFQAVGGNSILLTRDSDDAVAGLVSDIDGATDHVHLMFYIWLTDNNGLRVAEAVERAARRGVTCRVMVDAFGSRAMLSSAVWSRMEKAGATMGVAFPTSQPLLRMFISRIDVRDHRKVAVIDGDVCWFGSQNCADAAFRVKPRYAPWVDVFFRGAGPVARQLQMIFAADWLTHMGEDLSPLLSAPLPPPQGEEVAIAYGTGPRINPHAVSDSFQLAIGAAQRDLTITTPYYVPNEPLQDELCSAAMRGVRVRILFPARNDSRFVAWASQSYYEALLESGIEIYEYRSGLLHAKTMAIDDDAVLVGSANMDRRSLDLNYENNVLVFSPDLNLALRARQEDWLADCNRLTLEEVRAWSLPRRLLNSAMATLGPVL